MSVKLLIGADIVPTESNFELFRSGDRKRMLGDELSEILEKAEFRIFNLEVPLIDKPYPIDKWGPNLIAPTNTIKGYKALGIDLLTLANNHILDQGEKGLFSTIKALKDAGINYLGAANNLEKAELPFIFESFDKKIGVYACAEHEFSIADERNAGANPFNPLLSFEHVANLKESTDYVIVLYHGGKEQYRYPSPNLQKICRRFVDAGADLVICQHSHCVGCEEKWGSSTIVYGQGNFLFDHSEAEEWQTSILIQLDEALKVTYIPLIKDKETVRLASGEMADKILNGFYKRSKEITQPDFVINNYKALAEKTLNNYLLFFLGHRNLLFRVINIVTKGRFAKFIINRRYKAKNRIRLINYIECETHRELLLSGLKNEMTMKI